MSRFGLRLLLTGILGLLTGNLTWGLILSSLAVPRLVASLLFVPEPPA
jgi:hypothetical protein